MSENLFQLDYSTLHHPRVSWGTEAGEGLESKESNGKMGNLVLQEGELPTSSLYCPLSRRWASQGWGSLQESNGDEATIKHKRKLI